MKFDFNNSTYAKIWDSIEGRQITQMILNDPDLIRTNIGFAYQKFNIDPAITPTLPDGSATFISRQRQMNMATLAHMRAPLGDTIYGKEANAKYYTGVIPDFTPNGFMETAMEREDKEKRFINEFGNDAFLISQYADKLQTLIDSADMTLAYMAAQLLSKGFIIYDQGEGTKGNLYKADIPAENFCKAGAVAWNDESCMLLDQMVEIEKKYEDLWGASYSMQWEITYDMFHKVFLKNKQVIDLVKSYRFFNNQPITDNMTVTESMFRAAVAEVEGLSPIVIIEEKQKDVNNGIVHGWKDGVAVYRPTGYAGMIRHTENLDSYLYQKYGNNLIAQSFATTNNGLYTIANLTVPNGRMKEWQTQLMFQAIPSLDEFLYHVIVDTTTANS